MNTGTFVLLIGIGSLMIIVMFVTIITRRGQGGPKRKGQFDIVADELERHKRENFHLKAELKRLNSLNNLFFALRRFLQEDRIFFFLLL